VSALWSAHTCYSENLFRQPRGFTGQKNPLSTRVSLPPPIRFRYPPIFPTRYSPSVIHPSLSELRFSLCLCVASLWAVVQSFLLTFPGNGQSVNGTFLLQPMQQKGTLVLLQRHAPQYPPKMRHSPKRQPLLAFPPFWCQFSGASRASRRQESAVCVVPAPRSCVPAVRSGGNSRLFAVGVRTLPAGLCCD
jgi:hypothetical protein